MSIKPILFNTDMVRAILDGRKTVTRRVFKGAPDRDDLKPYHVRGTYGLITTTNSRVYESTPPCVPGDILWVRETWGTWSRTDGIMPKIYYKADGGAPDGIKWHPSIHMPRAAARIFLRVTDVRVERLQDITEEGVFQEGISEEYADNIAEPDCQHTIYFPDMAPGPCWVCDPCKKCPYYFSYPELFGWFVWNETIKPADRPRYGWAANPWVWVIEFERLPGPPAGFYGDNDTGSYADNPILSPA